MSFQKTDTSWKSVERELFCAVTLHLKRIQSFSSVKQTAVDQDSRQNYAGRHSQQNGMTKFNFSKLILTRRMKIYLTCSAVVVLSCYATPHNELLFRDFPLDFDSAPLVQRPQDKMAKTRAKAGTTARAKTVGYSSALHCLGPIVSFWII